MTTISANARRTIRRHLKKAGYSTKEVAAGLAYAAAQGATSTREAYILTVSRILYTADDLAEGARFAVEDGFGPR